MPDEDSQDKKEEVPNVDLLEASEELEGVNDHLRFEINLTETGVSRSMSGHNSHIEKRLSLIGTHMEARRFTETSNTPIFTPNQKRTDL